jgi:glycogen synthase
MRIAFLTSEFITESDSFDGGLSNYLFKVASELISYGHEPIVIVSSFENNCFEYEGIYVYRVNPKRTLIYKAADKLSRFKIQVILDLLLQSYCLNKKLKEIHKTNKIDIVHYPSFNAISLFAPKNIASVLRLSGYQKLWDEANGIHNKKFKDKIYQKIEDYTLKKAQHIFGPSEFLANVINEKFNKKVTIIETPYQNNKIKLNLDIVNDINKKTNGNKYLLFFGRIALFKGAIDIADILKPLLSKYPNLYIVIIGKDVGFKNEKSINYIYNKAGNYKDRVLYYKEKPHEQLMAVIQNAKFILLPSRIENFPNASVEAMSFNKIVVATKGVSFEQLINDEINGFLCENGNPDDLLRVIEKVLSLPSEKKKEIEYNAGETIKRLHPDIIIKKLIEYYQSILKS